MLHEGIGATKLDQTEPTIFRKFSTLTRFFLDLFYMFHGRYWNCRPQNSARYNRKICQRVENTSFRERLSCILQAFAKDHQDYKSNFGFHVPFDRENPANPFLDSPKGTHPKGNSPEKEVGVPRPPARRSATEMDETSEKIVFSFNIEKCSSLK